MKKVSILLYQSYLEDVIKKLHEQGLVQIINIEKDDQTVHDLLQKTEAPPEASTFSTYELRLTKLIDILAKTKKTPKGITAILHPELPVPKEIQSRSAQELTVDVEHVFDSLEKKILDYDNQLRQLDEYDIKNKDLETQLSLIKDFSVQLDDLKETSHVIVIAGKTQQFSELEQQIDLHQEAISLESKEYGTRKKKEWAVLLAGHSSEKEKIERLTREYLTVFEFTNLSGTPAQALEEIHQSHQMIQQQKQTLLKELSEYAQNHLTDLYALREEIQFEHARKEIIDNFAQTQTTYLIKGWALERDQQTIHSLIDTTCHGQCSLTFDTPSNNPDTPPTYLEMPKWASTFRTFLELFATPKYHELNPTIFLGIFFIIFFGFMLGDAGYGVVILLLSLFGYLKFGKHSPFLKNWSFLGIWLGTTTTIVGFLMNSFFGDFVPRFIYHDTTQPLYSANIAGIQLPLDSLGDPLIVLTIALLLGLVHLNLGIVLGLIQAVRQKKYKLCITQYFAWIPLQIGGGTLIGVFILRWEISTLMMYTAIALTLIGIILVFLHSGPIGFFGITGYVGDWLSYARILALGLATSGMALAFNVVAELVPMLVPVVGIILFPILLVVLHTANLGIQSLGAAVHSLRLQYVEFFNRFYEGGGNEFDPFQTKRRYTKVEKTEE